jgi:glycosyltransferase involved in cell wall biosynthesis
VNRPLVSVVTPVLNRAEAMAACLASVTRQTYRPIEHIVVDGGSTDGTLELISQYRPSHAFRWISEPDSGMYDALNKGMSLAQGDVLAYLNSDDRYLPWSVEVAVRALQPEIDLIYGDLGVISAQANGTPGSFYLQFYPNFNLRHYTFVGSIGQPTVFWRRSLTQKIGLFDIRYRLIGDCEYWLRAALVGATLRHIPEVMAVQFEHQGTLRETEATRLREEFNTLRHAMMAVVAPPSSLRWERFKRSVVWRARQLEFYLAVKARHAQKWRHFVESLHAHGVDMTLRDLRMLAPARWRGNASLFGDASAISEVLGGPAWR